jgi:hypothetical protein
MILDLLIVNPMACVLFAAPKITVKLKLIIITLDLLLIKMESVISTNLIPL